MYGKVGVLAGRRALAGLGKLGADGFCLDFIQREQVSSRKVHSVYI
jgi:hypothetical protein